ncbi:BnaC05g10260D [Brassica napus]|uniref:O-fucosyltransferase family protein n=2 Tax=Brassica TaxID=3705 RepID=A0A078HDI1_BRANA|nr:BnaC05g10260D [Brassica napus]VDD42376.1 unnamed protein product [Brassica oleracea]
MEFGGVLEQTAAKTIFREGRWKLDQPRSDKLPPPSAQKPRLQVWFVTVCSAILVWTCLVQLFSAGELRHTRIFTGLTHHISSYILFVLKIDSFFFFVFAGNYTSNGVLLVLCNGGLNQMRSAICDMVAVARLLNLTLVVPELDKTSFWADPSGFEDIFDVRHFIDSLRDEVRIFRRLPKRYSTKSGYQMFQMPPVSWSDDNYYLNQILPLFSKHKVVHFNRTDTRLANNGLPLSLQRLSDEEAEELKKMRYTYPWWREKEIVSEERRAQGLCPLTPEEVALVLKALGFDKNTQIYIAAGEIYGSEHRLSVLREAFPRIVKKEMLLESTELQQFQNHSSQMAALDFMVSVASNTFIPTYDGNIAKVVEGHRRYLGFKKTIMLDRKRLVELLDLHDNKTLTWDQFAVAIKAAHERRSGAPTHRRVVPDKPKEEDYFYANPQECLCEGTNCHDMFGDRNSSLTH